MREILLGKLVEQAADDILRGSTGLGPHRDDLILSLNGIEVRPYASQDSKDLWFLL